MSRFEAAQRKVGTTPAPKPAAKTGVAAVAKAPSKKAEVPKTLEDKKKYVKKLDIKITDLEDDLANADNSKAKKEIQVSIKKLKEDEVYMTCESDIREAEAQAKRDAERAAIAKSPTAKAKASPKAGPKAFNLPGIDEKEDLADEATMKEIDAMFSGTGKEAATAKAQAVSKLEALATSTPFVLQRLETLIGLYGDSKLGAPSIKATKAILAATQPEGHGLASLAMPALLAGMEDKKWKTKAGCIEALSPILAQMAASTPSQLADCLPQIVAKLAEAALEVRAEVRSATGTALREIGKLVESPEIQKLSQDLVTALAEPTNQKHTQAVLAKMGNATFMSLLDAASLALLMPIVIRGMKERESMSKKWSSQIFGSTSQLVQDTQMVIPYLKSVVPLLKAGLTDPVGEVAREAAKVFGILEAVVPKYSRTELQPYLFNQMRNGDAGERIGASLAFAEVFLKMDVELAAKLMPEVQAGARTKERGFLELMDTMPLAMKMDFTPHIELLFPTMLMAILGDKDQVEDVGYRASLSLVQRFGDLCTDRLLPAFEGTYCACLLAKSGSDYEQQQRIRECCAILLGKVAEKVLEHKKFGQDLLTTTDCSGADQSTRERLLCLVMLMRSDHDAGVKRVANGTWKAVGGAPKMLKAFTPALEKFILNMRSGAMGAGVQKVACDVLDEQVKAGLLTAPEDAMPEAAEFIFPPVVPCNDKDSAQIASGKAPDSAGEESDAAARGRDRIASSAQDFIENSDDFSSLPADVRKHCGAVAISVTREGRRRKASGKKIAEVVVTKLAVTLNMAGDAGVALLDKLPLLAEASVRAAMGDAFDAVDESGGHDDDILLRVENLLLMYGAGHLLLRDTTLEMRKNQRYGIVGHNGAGKTTLMKEIARHNIVGMPAHLKCVHVDDSKLGEMSKSSLNTVEYAMKLAKDMKITNANRDTLLNVGFNEKMLEEPIADLSTGWRMRLTLSVCMLKHADLVLLDEPTNHLDEQSVAWLSDYIMSIDQSSVMVISHEPKFLNKVCTHVVAYTDKKLDYTEGNFNSFAAKKGLSKEQIDQMLSGNLSFDTMAEGDEEEGAEKGAKVNAPVTGPPKLTFPIPGTMEGVKTGSKSVLELKNASFRFSKDKDYLFKNINAKLSLSSRVAICGRNGCGKSTLMTLICSEMSPAENEDGKFGDVSRHCNLRLAYMKQDHLKALGPYFDTSCFVYITDRFKEGCDGDLQKRLTEPEDEEEAERRANLAKKYGKYGNQVEDLVSRSKAGKDITYEVKWAGLDDPKQNTIEPLSKLVAMGLSKVVIACDERIAAKTAGIDQRPLSRREVSSHCERFGIDEEMCCNRQVRGFSSGQKVRLSLAAMFWTKPHLIALDEPTNYLDVETVDALVKALTNFRGGVIMIEPKTDFVERICNEKWWMEDGGIRVEKLNNGVKRQA